MAQILRKHLLRCTSIILILTTVRLLWLKFLVRLASAPLLKSDGSDFKKAPAALHFDNFNPHSREVAVVKILTIFVGF